MTDKPEPTFSQATARSIVDFCIEPQALDAIANHLEAKPKAIEGLLESLTRQGDLQRIKGKRYLAPNRIVAVGVFRRSKGRGKADGFVVPENRKLGLIDIPSGFSEGAQEGDFCLVNFRVLAARRGRKSGDMESSLAGRVLSIIEERPQEAVGVFEFNHNGYPRVRLEGHYLPRYAWVDEWNVPDLKFGAVVRVRLNRRPDSRGRTKCEILGSVGSILDAEHDLDNLIALYNYPQEFSEATLAEAEALPKDPDPKEFSGREDLRELLVITIDPKDAKDHDDAISIEELEDSCVRLGVHIADVSHYVTPDSALNTDAFERGNSVYLPGRLIPMLPNSLSAGVCSLHEGVDRLAKSAFLTFDSRGRIVRRELVNSVINVRKFLTYEDVLPVIEDNKSSGDRDVYKLIHAGRSLADKLKAGRIKRGALMLEIPRPHVYVDDKGEVTSVEPEQTDDAHNLIEEFMLAANEAVGEFLWERGLPYIGRVHPAPNEEAEESFGEYCDELSLPKPAFDKPGALQRFLESTRKHAAAEAINYALLRSLQRATYKHGPAEHFALGTDKYVHFTSPIRRYADTVTHQILNEYLKISNLRWSANSAGGSWLDGTTKPARVTRDGRKIVGYEAYEYNMSHVAAVCTQRIIAADKGEMAADQIKILRTMRDRVGEKHKGTVIAFTGRAVIVRLDVNMAEGELELGELTNGWVELHKFWAQYETRNGHKKIMLGDELEVEIGQVDLISRTLRLIPKGKHSNPSRQHSYSGGRSRGGSKSEGGSKKSGRSGKGSKKKNRRR
ncbi:MAG: ribonuclease R [Planctomycetes bacterium]|nr:ribonuclease R [Planctomycetota bacterium]